MKQVTTETMTDEMVLPLNEQESAYCDETFAYIPRGIMFFKTTKCKFHSRNNNSSVCIYVYGKLLHACQSMYSSMDSMGSGE